MAQYLNFFGKVMPTSGGSSRGYYATSAVNHVLTGTTASEWYSLQNQAGLTVYGGGGDDIFYGAVSDTKIIVPNSSATTTVYVSGDYTLPDYMTNLFSYWSPTVLNGNASNNIVSAPNANVTIDGGKGNDVLIGVAGDNYRFGTGSGYDVINNFHPGARTSVTVNPDTVQLSGYSQFTSFSQVTAAMTQSGADVILRLDANDSIKFLNTRIAAFTPDNFLLSYAPTGLKMSFDQEFNSAISAAGGSSSSIWRTDYGWGATSNSVASRTLANQGEKQIYVDPGMLSATTGKPMGLNPFSVSNGVLDIHAGPAAATDVAGLSGYKFTSGLLTTRNSFTQTYGYFEARMQLPAGGGAWPAFWLYSANNNRAEIDVMESYNSSTWSATSHDLTTGTDVRGSSTISTPDLSTSFHNYGVLWTASTITWYLDGVAVRSEATPADMHGPMYMILDLALTSSTPSTFSGADLKVDYVHAYSLDNLPASVTSMGGGNQTLTDSAGATVLNGLGVNDTFYVSNTATQVVQAANGGTSTVWSSVNFTLPNNVQNLVLTGAATQGTGNAMGNRITGNDNGNILTGGAGNDVIIGGKGNDTIRSGAGNDVVTGGAGSDLFAFAASIGKDVITDFNAVQDHLDLTALANRNFTLKDSTAGAVLDFGTSGSVTFTGVHVVDLIANNTIHATSMTHIGTDYAGVI